MKLNPYSLEGIHYAIHKRIVEEWSGLSKIKSKDDSLNFTNLLSDVISISLEQSKLWFDEDVLNFLDDKLSKKIIKNSEFNVRSLETKELEKIKEDLEFIYSNKKEREVVLELEKYLHNYIEKKYYGIDEIKPKKLSEINELNIENELVKIKNNKKERLSDFKGFHYKLKNNFHFVDTLTAPIVYYNNLEHGKKPIETLIKGIVSYVLKTNEINNTNYLLDKINNIIDYNLKITDPEFNFNGFKIDKEREIIKKQNKINKTSISEIKSIKKE